MRSADLRRDRPVQLHEAVALEALVAEQEHAAGAEAARPPGRRRGLHVVGGDDAREAARPGGIELVGLPLLRSRQELRQADRRRPRADLHEPRLVRDRQRDRRRAGVELSDVGDRARVLDRLAGVLGCPVGIPADPVAARGRVVRGREVHLEVPHPAARVAQRQLLGVDDALRLRRPAAPAAGGWRRSSACRPERCRRGSAPPRSRPRPRASGRMRQPAGISAEEARQHDRDRGGAILTSAVRCLDEPCLLPRLQPGARHVADPHPLRVVPDRDLGDLGPGLVGDRRDLVVPAPGDEAVAAVGAVGRPVRLGAAVDQLVRERVALRRSRRSPTSSRRRRAASPRGSWRCRGGRSRAGTARAASPGPRSAGSRPG